MNSNMRSTNYSNASRTPDKFIKNSSLNINSNTSTSKSKNKNSSNLLANGQANSNSNSYGSQSNILSSNPMKQSYIIGNPGSSANSNISGQLNNNSYGMSMGPNSNFGSGPGSIQPNTVLGQTFSQHMSYQNQNNSMKNSIILNQNNSMKNSTIINADYQNQSYSNMTKYDEDDDNRY